MVWNIKSQEVSQLWGLVCLSFFHKPLGLLISGHSFLLPQHISFLYLVIALSTWVLGLPVSHHVSPGFSLHHETFQLQFLLPVIQFILRFLFPVLYRNLIRWAQIYEPGQTTEYWQTCGLAAIDSAWGRHLLVLVSRPLARKLWMSPFLSEDKSRISHTSSLAGFIFLSCALGDTRSVEIQCEAIVET